MHYDVQPTFPVTDLVRHHHLPPWIRSFGLFRDRHVSTLSWWGGGGLRASMTLRAMLAGTICSW